MIAEFALFVFTTLGGLAAGFYVAAAFFPLHGKRNNLLVSIVPLALLAIGGIALLTHLGRPERMFNAFANLQAGIAQEGIATGLFGIVLVVDLALTCIKGAAPKALRYVGAVFAVVLTIIMGLAYYSYESMPMWHSLPTIPLFAAADLAIGALLAGALDDETAQNKTLWLFAGVLAVIGAVAFAGSGMVFAQNGLSAVPFVLAAVVAAAVAVFALLKGKDASSALRWGMFAAYLVAIVVGRYAFYAAF